MVSFPKLRRSSGIAKLRRMGINYPIQTKPKKTISTYDKNPLIKRTGIMRARKKETD
jgi:hypothetical protein